MQARYTWEADNIRWQYKYVDLLREEEGVSHIDYIHFDEIEPLEPSAPAVPATQMDPHAVPGA